MVDGFPDKLTLVLKSLSVSRVSLAAELGVNKSVVSRWLAGATAPSEYNLARLSAHIGKLIPGFTALDWDRDLADFAGVIGVAKTAEPVSAPAAPPRGLVLPFIDEIRAATKLRGPSYEGLYRSTRPFAAQPGLYMHDHVLVRRGPDGLLTLRMMSGGVRVEGWVLPLNNQLFVVSSEFTSGSMTFGLFNGVHSVVVEVLDGIVLTPSFDVARTPTASRMVLHRIANLGDAAEDEATLAELDARQRASTADLVAPEVQIRLAGGDPVDPEDFMRGLLRMGLGGSLSRGPGPWLPK